MQFVFSGKRGRGRVIRKCKPRFKPGDTVYTYVESGDGQRTTLHPVTIEKVVNTGTMEAHHRYLVDSAECVHAEIVWGCYLRTKEEAVAERLTAANKGGGRG